MLEHLFGSRTRVKLLSLFLRNPDEALYVREITRRVNTQINAVRRELSNLRKLGLIMEIEEAGASKSRQPGLKKKYYKINPDFKLLSEMTQLVMRARVLLEGRLDQEIIEIGDIRYMAFLGAFLGGARSAPVDLFIVGEVDQDRLKALLVDSEEALGFEINFSVMSLDEFQYRKDMTDRFLYAVLEAPKNVVVDRLAERAAVS